MKNIILCADDYGQNETISQAIISLVAKNRLSATSCMTTFSDWPAAAKWLLPFKNQIDIGFHFNLTEGQPASKALSEAHGFMPLTTLLLRAFCRRLNRQVIEAELHAQLDLFADAMGCMPDFIDGHQHVHQFPVIRHALLNVYEERLKETACYIRSIYEPDFISCFLRGQRSFKQFVLQASGAAALKSQLMKKQIPHNSSFSGIYEFNESAHYAEKFRGFLQTVKENGIIMCHPGVQSGDSIGAARNNEFAYLESDQFASDCLHSGVSLGRFSK